MHDISAAHNHLTASRNYNGDKTITISDVDVSFNDYNFNGLEFIAGKVLRPVYANQAPLSIHTHGTKLAVTAGGTLSNNTYTWYQSGIATAVATIQGDSTFQPATSGQYFANITNKLATALTLTTDTVSYTTATAIAKNTLAVSLYPNPAKDYLLISGMNGKDAVKLTVADLSGYVWMTTIGKNATTQKIDIHQLKSGHYVMHVNDGKTITNLQFVKE